MASARKVRFADGNATATSGKEDLRPEPLRRPSAGVSDMGASELELYLEQASAAEVRAVRAMMTARSMQAKIKHHNKFRESDKFDLPEQRPQGFSTEPSSQLLLGTSGKADLSAAAAPKSSHGSDPFPNLVPTEWISHIISMTQIKF